MYILHNSKTDIEYLFIGYNKQTAVKMNKQSCHALLRA